MKQSFASFRPAILMAVGAFLTATAFSQQVAMNVTHDPRKPQSDWFLGANGTYVSGPNAGQTLFGGTANLLCFNRYAHNPTAEGEVNNYTIVPPSTLIENAGGVAKGEAIVNWMFDTYYADYTVLPYSTTIYAFQLALWEIAHDFDGTVGSLNIYAGRNNLSSSQPTSETVLNGVITNFDSISSSYRSSNYNITFLESAISANQDMLLVTAIPEPGSLALLGLAGVVAIGRRKRPHS